MKRALHFATKLNSRDNQKCNCFWVPPMICLPLLATQFMAGGQGIITCNRDWWEGMWGEVICHKKFNSPFRTKVCPPPPHSPNQNFPWMRPCKIICRALLLNVSNVVAPVNVFSCLQVAEHGVRYKRQQSGYIFFYLYK